MNLHRAAAMNARLGETHYGETKFSDWTPEEFAKIYLTAKPINNQVSLEV
jgi:hypothetical protein